MGERLSRVMYGFVVFAFLVLSGCPPPATTKPEESKGPAPAAKEKTPAVKETTKPGSLEEFKRGEPGKEGPLKEVYFDFDRYNIRPDARETLKTNAGWLKNNPLARVEIEGHCDERGTGEYNLALGAKRAQAAKDYLVSLGVAAGRLSTISYGKEVPVCREKTEECWQRNRRARFVVLPAKPAS